MTMPKDRPTIKDDAQYEALRKKGYSKEKAARIANDPEAERHGGESPPYEEWTKEELYDRAAELDIGGRSEMTKSELIEALRA